MLIHEEKRRKQYKCGVCQELGHNKRTCPEKTNLTQQMETKNEPAEDPTDPADELSSDPSTPLW